MGFFAYFVLERRLSGGPWYVCFNLEVAIQLKNTTKLALNSSFRA